MKIRYLLPQDGTFYKANLHSHTTVSDGYLTPEQSKELYKKEGYSILAYTDHEIYTYHEELTDDDFLVLAGLEAGVSDPDIFWPVRKVYHLNLIDTDPTQNTALKLGKDKKEEDPDFFTMTMEYNDIGAINAYIKEMSDLGFLVTYNHPWWSLQTYEDYSGLEHLFAMEIYNYGCEHDGLYGAAPQAYDEMLRAGMLRKDEPLFCLSTDDNHNVHPVGHQQNDAFGGYVMVKAEELTYPSVIEALQAGDFYSVIGPEGPEIHELYLKDESTLVVECSPVEKIYVITDSRNTYREVAPIGETITRAEFELSGEDAYIRVDCRDTIGRHAYSNAYPL